MNHSPITITVKSWQDVIAEYKFSAVEQQSLFKMIDNVANQLPTELNYVYEAEFKFGDKLIDNGIFHSDRFIVKSNEFKKSLLDFRKDLGYSQDPLGLVLTNHIEVYTENCSSRTGTYPIFLDELHEGSFFGVFGALGYLTDIKEKKEKKSHWSVIAGNFCIDIAFSWKEGSTIYIEKTIKDWFLREIPSAKYRFLKEYAPKDWSVKAVYFPEHFLTIQKVQIRIALENELFKIGWKQANPLKEYLLDNKAISDAIYQKNGKYSNGHHFLCVLYDFLFQVSLGKRKIMMPITKDHIGYTILENFRDQNKQHFKRQIQKVPLFFKYDYLSAENAWGLISLTHPPIPFCYGALEPDKIATDMDDIGFYLPNEINMPHLTPCINKSQLDMLKENVLIPEFSKIIGPEFYKPLEYNFTMKAQSIALNDGIFSKLLLIKRQ